MTSSDYEHGLIRTEEDVQIEYILAGIPHDETIVFVPGLGANLQQYRPQVAYFGEHYRTVAISLRGHGESTYPSNATEADFTFEKLATDVQRVLEHLRIETTHVVGNSTGGVIGYQLIAQTPKMVRSLTTFGTAAEIHTGLMGQVIVLLDRLLGPKGDAWLVQKTVSENEAVARQVADMVRTTAKPALVNLRRNLVDYNYLPTLKKHSNIPLLLIQGERDREVNSIIDTTISLFQHRKNAQIAQIKGAGHITNLDQPASFNRVLSDFLTRINSTN